MTVPAVLWVPLYHLLLVVETDSPKLNGDLTVVSPLHLGHTVQYRVAGDPPPGSRPTGTAPSLEAGYVWLMREGRVAA